MLSIFEATYDILTKYFLSEVYGTFVSVIGILYNCRKSQMAATKHGILLFDLHPLEDS